MPLLSRYGDFPELDTQPVAYTPDRLGDFPDPSEMMLIHCGELELGSTYQIAGRLLRISRQTDIDEFYERCPNAPRFLRQKQMKYFVAVPEEAL